jgi:pilus assembly protein CpaC
MKSLSALIASVAVAASLAAAAPAAAQVSPEQGGTHTIVVAKDKSAAFRLDYPASEIVVAQPDTLALVATTDRSFYVRGKALGVTNILIYDMQHRLAQVVDVRVGYDTESLQADLAAALPGENIRAANFAGGILLSGEASNSNSALRAMAIAERYAPKQVQSSVTIRSAQQVMVEVRMIEASRTALKDLGVDLDIHNISGFKLNTGNGLLTSNTPPQGTLGIGTNIGTTSIDFTLRALEQKGVIHTLARPNLIAMSGEEANFLAGGEFPYPVPNGNNGVTIEFRTFGVKLNVTPVVEDNGQIRLKVAPEVSQLDPRNGLHIQGFEVPAITTRRASTVVELRDGQSFAIAGLFEKTMIRSVNQVPWAGDVPVLGALFKSTDWQKNQTELVIIVTPRLTSPADTTERLPDPLRGAEEPSAIDLILMGKGFATPDRGPGSMAQEQVTQIPVQTVPLASAPAESVPVASEPLPAAAADVAAAAPATGAP